MKPRLLDLFCGAGGCAVGYSRAGFEVIGIDLNPMPRYPFEFHRGDALEYLVAHGHEFDAIHASPPCQRHSKTWALHGRKKHHPELIAPTRKLLIRLGVPYVIENVEGAPLLSGAVMLCGVMFGLKVFRHRIFECSFGILAPEHIRHPGICNSHRLARAYRGGRNGYITVAGHNHDPKISGPAMGIDWMTRDEMSQAIPPAYTHFIGDQMMSHVLRRMQSQEVA